MDMVKRIMHYDGKSYNYRELEKLIKIPRSTIQKKILDGKTVNQIIKENGDWYSKRKFFKQYKERNNESFNLNKITEYNTWMGMRRRCHDKRLKHYHNYGGRGIKVCDRWFTSFENFYVDMGPNPGGLSIDRIDNDGNYEPSNCRWANQHEQHRNTRHSRRITHEGETRTMFEWADSLGISRATIATRMDRGWTDPKDLLRSPTKKPRNRRKK